MYLPKRKWLSQWWKSRLLKGIEGGFSLLTKHGFKCLVNYKLKIKVDMQMSFYYYNLPGVSVRNPARDKVMRKEAWQNTRTWSGFRGSLWTFLNIHPARPESACFTVLCFPPTLLSLTGGCPPTTFFWKKLELLDNKSPGHNTSVSIQKPLWWLSSLPVQLRMWLFEASHLKTS